MNNKSHTEIEVRFLNIDKNDLISRLKKLKAKDLGEEFYSEIIFYDKEKTWLDQQKFIRIRTDSKGSRLSYKHQQEYTADGTKEIEFDVSDIEKMTALLNELGIEEFRIQQKRRHSFLLDDVTIDIDEWPNVPVYVELEGRSEEELKKIASKLEFDWKNAVFENAKIVIEKYYNIPVSTFKYFTFEKSE